jgi:hypothetical protein
MDTLYHEVQTREEIRMRGEETARQYETDRLVHLVTRNGVSAVGAAWASVAAGLGRLAKRGAYAVRSALTGPSEPSEQCC